MTDISAISLRAHDTGFEQGSIAAANAIIRYLNAMGQPVVATMVLDAWNRGDVQKQATATIEGTAVPAPVDKPKPAPVTSYQQARQLGYTGDACSNCQGVHVKRNGSCLLCEDCGQTTGCS